MNNKETIKKIEEMMQSGLSQQVIFNDLGRSDDFARLVVSVPSFDNRKNFAKSNTSLFFIFIYIAIVNILFLVINLIVTNISLAVSLISLPATIFISLVSGYFAVNVKNYRGTIYIPAGLLSIALFCSNAAALFKSDITTSEIILWSVLNLPLLAGAYLSFYLRKKLCPSLGYWGAKTDAQGNYIFKEKG